MKPVLKGGTHMNHLLVIGGCDAGISAASRARELSLSTDITVLVADRFPSFSICGLPFLLSEEVTDWKTLAHRSAAQIEKEGIRILLNHRATEIDPRGKGVTAVDKNGKAHALKFDQLVIVMGAASVRPPRHGFEEWPDPA